MDDKTIALTGQYAPPIGTPEEAAPAPSSHARKPRKAKRAKSADDGGDTGEAPNDDGPALMDLKDAPLKRSGDGLASDPLDRLLQSLPPDLKVVDMINLGSRPTRQILVRAKIIDINRNSAKNLGVKWGSLESGTSRTGNVYDLQPQPFLFGQFPAGGGAFNGSLLGRRRPRTDSAFCRPAQRFDYREQGAGLVRAEPNRL